MAKCVWRDAAHQFEHSSRCNGTHSEPVSFIYIKLSLVPIAITRHREVHDNPFSSVSQMNEMAFDRDPQNLPSQYFPLTYEEARQRLKPQGVRGHLLVGWKFIR